jgi:hypothetical protein
MYATISEKKGHTMNLRNSRILKFVMLLPLFSGIFLLPGIADASGCSYGSTQARVQKDITDPWKPSITITRGQSVNVGGFHNGTGQFASDVSLNVVGPGLNGYYSNGQQAYPPYAGQYQLVVRTINQSGGGCEETATINVVEPTTNTECRYGSTEARVQRNIHQPWGQTVFTTVSEGFNVGSFHNQTGQFAGDTEIRIFGNGFNGTPSVNGARVMVPSTGWYRVHVSTKNQFGPACEQDAWAFVMN